MYKISEDGVVRDLTQEEIDQLNWERSKDNSAQQQKTAGRVRSKRDSLLQETDWMALSDVTMTPEMAAYRQALRDVPDQEGFPFDVVFPTKP